MTLNTTEQTLREALEASGQRYTEQRAAVYRYLNATDVHPTADEVYLAVRQDVRGISLGTVYKSLETLVGCGLAIKLSYADHSARYDGRTDPHHHARCLACGKVRDVMGEIPAAHIDGLGRPVDDFLVTGYRLELSGYCTTCAQGEAPAADR